MADKTVKKISVIPAEPKQKNRLGSTEKEIHVAAYCRVSTLLEEQDTSYEAQVRYYTQKIQETPGWKMAGIYADDGISGTNTKRRHNFQAMIQNAMEGKIDLILTKSISRFARNTVDSLSAIRQLKEKNIAVVFEKEGINSLESSGEMLITILSSLAQEESRNISENIRWGLARKYETGSPSINHTMFMGYTKDENGELVIVPEEAGVVKLIFRLYLEGYSVGRIKKYLEEHEIKTCTGKDKWHNSVIENMLRNEKYMGDLRIQKTYTADFITKKRLPNNGVLPQYYVEDNHEPIIPKELFYRVQEEIMRRAAIKKTAETKKKKQKGKYSSKYALTGLIICGECGHEYRRVTWSKKGTKKIVWRCSSRLEKGTKVCKASPTIEERLLQNGVMEAIRKIVKDEHDYIDTFRRNVIRVISERKQTEETEKYQALIQQKKNEMAELIVNFTDGFGRDEFEAQYQSIAREIVALQKKQQTAMQQADGKEADRIKQIDDFIQKSEEMSMEYDEYLIRTLVASVQLLSAEAILVRFKSGLYLEVKLC